MLADANMVKRGGFLVPRGGDGADTPDEAIENPHVIRLEANDSARPGVSP